MTKLAMEKGFDVRSERLMFFDPGTGQYSYRVLSSLDPGRTGNTQITIDGRSGRIVSYSLPTGSSAGTTFTTWIQDIHVADVFGLPMKFILTITGLSIASLSITGVWLWVRKRRTRRNPRYSG